MSKVIFFSIPAHGHTNPTLPLVAELVRRGEEVIYYSSNEFKEKIISTGAVYKDYRLKDYDPDVDKAGKNLAFLYYYLIKTTASYIEILIEEVQSINPDYIIHDSICPWGRYVASICNIPAVSSISTFAFQKEIVKLSKVYDFIKQSSFSSLLYILKARKLQKKMEKQYGVKRRNFIETMMNEEQLNIVYTSKDFQPESHLFNSEKYKFTGPSITEKKNDPDKTDYSKLRHPVIYVSMGTIWKDSFSIEGIVDALLEFNGSIVLSGKCKDNRYKDVDNVIIKDHINQLEVLKYCDVFITHGGMNSVSEGLYNGVPLCVHPFQMEQVEVANRIVELQCGIIINNLSGNNLQKAVTTLIGNNIIKQNCERMSVSFKEAGGYRKATDYIFEYITQL